MRMAISEATVPMNIAAVGTTIATTTAGTIALMIGASRDAENRAAGEAGRLVCACEKSSDFYY